MRRIGNGVIRAATAKPRAARNKARALALSARSVLSLKKNDGYSQLSFKDSQLKSAQ